MKNNETKATYGEHIEPAKVAMNKYCSSCAIGAVCLLDGPIPDFEVAGIAGLLGLAN